jgi:hypothetical protein
MNAAALAEVTLAHINKTMTASNTMKYATFILGCSTHDFTAMCDYWVFHDLPVPGMVDDSTEEILESSHCTCGGTLLYNVHTCDYVCDQCGLCNYQPNDMYHHFGAQQFESMHHTTVHRINRYKRITNLKTILRNLQGYSTAFHPLLREFIAEIKGTRNLTIDSLRVLMKKEHLSRFYHKAYSIMSIVSPEYVPLRIKSDNLRCIIGCFNLYVREFEHTVKRVRKNFVTYHYALRMICLEYGFLYIIPYLNLLRSDTTEKSQNIVWINLRERIDSTCASFPSSAPLGYIQKLG